MEYSTIGWKNVSPPEAIVKPLVVVYLLHHVHGSRDRAGLRSYGSTATAVR